MGKIILSEPEGPYRCQIDTAAMTVTIREVFLGVSFKTDKGQTLSVNMRDGGFEVKYAGHIMGQEFDTKRIEFKEGIVILKGVDDVST